MPPAGLAGIHVRLEAVRCAGGRGLVGGEEVGATGLVVEAVVLVEYVRLGHLHAGRAHRVGGDTDTGDDWAGAGRQVSAAGRQRWGRGRGGPAGLRLLWQHRTVLFGVQWRSHRQHGLLGYGDRVRRPVGVVPQITDRVLDQRGQGGGVDTEIGIGVVQVGEQEDGHPVGQHPHVLHFVDFDVGGEHQTDVVPIDDAVELGGVRHGGVPAAHGVLVDQVEQLDAVVAHDPGRGVGVRATFVQCDEVVVAILRPGLVPQDPRGDSELAVTGQGTEVQGAIAVGADRGEGHAEDALLAPLEVDAGHVEVAPQRIREEVGVRREAPGLVQLPGVRDQAIAQFVREIGVGIVAVLANVHGDVGYEGVRIGVHGGQFEAPDPGVRGQVEDVDRVGAGIRGGVADADGTGVQDPQPTALVHLDAVGRGDAVGAVSGRVGPPVRVRDQLRGARQAVVHVDVGQSGRNACEEIAITIISWRSFAWRVNYEQLLCR